MVGSMRLVAGDRYAPRHVGARQGPGVARGGMAGRMQGWREATLGRIPVIGRNRGGAAVAPKPPQKRKLPWYYKTAVIAGSVLLVLSGTALGLYYGLGNHYD